MEEVIKSEGGGEGQGKLNQTGIKSLKMGWCWVKRRSGGKEQVGAFSNKKTF